MGVYNFTATSGDVVEIGTFTDSLPADATVDLSALQPDGSPSSGEIGGVKFSNVRYSAGTGLIDPFVRIQGTNQLVEQGYNSSTTMSSPDPQFQETGKYGSQYNHALMLSDIPIAFIYDYDTHQFIAYRQFLLDINETKGNGQEYLSLEALQIYQSDSNELYAFTGSPTTTGSFSGGTDISLRYNMDADDVTTWVALNFNLNPGSGYGDVSVYVPDSLFDPDLPYVYLYSAFGDQNKNQKGYLWEFSDGFEEWSRGVGVPRAVSDLTGSKFYDANGDGIFNDGDLAWTPANGFDTPVTVYLDQNMNGVMDWTDGNSNGIWGPGEGERWTTTDSDGNYTFTELPAGLGADSTYYVREVVPTNYAQTAPVDGTYSTGVTGDDANVSGYKIEVQINTADVTYILPAFGNKLDVGYFKISKVFDPLTSGFTGTFDIVYNCGDGDVTVSLGAGETTNPIGPFPTGTSCTVSEATPSNAPEGWSFSAPSISGSPVTIVKGGQDAAQLVTITNYISRDMGYFKITKAFDALESGYEGTFDIVYNCGEGDVTVSLLAGQTTDPIGPFPTGTSCTVSEPTLPTAPTGWTFGTPDISGSPVTIVKGGEANAVEVTVTNTITKDRGTLTIEKDLTNNDNANVPATFKINYDCGLDTDSSALTGSFDVTPGTPEYVYNIPTGNSCTITEVTPTPIDGFTWMPVTYDPQSVEISTKNETFTVKAINTILPKSQFTDTMYCPLPDAGFRLIYIQDGVASDGTSVYKLTATNPGQYYYNVFYMGEPGAKATLNIVVPWPFITQGAVPIQVHEDVGFTPIDGQQCFVPSPSLPGYTITTQDDNEMSASGAPIITFNDYTDQDFTGSTIVHVEGVIPESGMLYVTIHLDYGLKRTTNWTNENPLGPSYPAYNIDTGITIDDPQVYEASYTGSDDKGGSSDDSDTFNSYNAFKKNPGVGGLSFVDPVNEQVYTKQDLTIRLIIPKSVKNAPAPYLEATTDEDGFFMINYKHTGKPTDYKVEVRRGTELIAQKTVQLQGNEFESVMIYLNEDTGGGGGGGGATAGTVYVADLQGTSKSVKQSWNATVIMTIKDETGALVPNAKVSGRWYVNGASIAAFCLTDITGTCSITLSKIDVSITSVSFEVTDVFVEGSYFDADKSVTHLTIPK